MTKEKLERETKVVSILGVVAILFIMLFFSFLVKAEPIDNKQAVRAIIGESSNQGFHGMLAVAVGIRNRGTLQGVYGVNAKHVDYQPEWVWEQARKAWKESKDNQIHTGDHWENIKAFSKPYWVDKMEEVYRHKDHVFYREEK